MFMKQRKGVRSPKLNYQFPGRSLFSPYFSHPDLHKTKSQTILLVFYTIITYYCTLELETKRFIYQFSSTSR